VLKRCRGSGCQALRDTADGAAVNRDFLWLLDRFSGKMRRLGGLRVPV